ncbi:MAG: hypothetical protein FWB72_01305 [Firmicutes bacterium]|nr:hypothetical protein [Bacillota bacterium]
MVENTWRRLGINTLTLVLIVSICVGLLTVLNVVFWVAPDEARYYRWMAQSMVGLDDRGRPAQIESGADDPENFIRVPVRGFIDEGRGIDRNAPGVRYVPGAAAQGAGAWLWNHNADTGAIHAWPNMPLYNEQEELNFHWNYYEPTNQFIVSRMFFNNIGTAAEPQFGSMIYIIARSYGFRGGECYVTIAIDTDTNLMEGIYLWSEGILNNFFPMERQYRMREAFDMVLNRAGVIAGETVGTVMEFRNVGTASRPNVTGGGSANPSITVVTNATQTYDAFIRALNGALLAFRNGLQDPFEIARGLFERLANFDAADLTHITAANVTADDFANSQVLATAERDNHSYVLVQTIGSDASRSPRDWGNRIFQVIFRINNDTGRLVGMYYNPDSSTIARQAGVHEPEEAIHAFRDLALSAAMPPINADPGPTFGGTSAGPSGEHTISHTGATTTVNQVAMSLNLVAAWARANIN